MADDPNTPLALALVGGAALCAFMAFRPWPQASGKPARPAAYAQSVFKGSPLPPGPAPTDDTQGIEIGLSAILSVWVLSKLASLFTGFPSFFGGEGGAEPVPGEEPPPEPVDENQGGEGEGGDGGIIGDIEKGAKDIEGDLGEVGE